MALVFDFEILSLLYCWIICGGIARAENSQISPGTVGIRFWNQYVKEWTYKQLTKEWVTRCKDPSATWFSHRLACSGHLGALKQQKRVKYSPGPSGLDSETNISRDEHASNWLKNRPQDAETPALHDWVIVLLLYNLWGRCKGSKQSNIGEDPRDWIQKPISQGVSMSAIDPRMDPRM